MEDGEPSERVMCGMLRDVRSAREEVEPGILREVYYKLLERAQYVSGFTRR